MAEYVRQVESNSPHPFKIYPEHLARFENCTPYPGWRFRLDLDGCLHHERIANPLLRWFDVARRKFQSR